MSRKHPAGTDGGASDGPRQFKQMKLDFFTSSTRQPKKPRTETEAHQEKSTNTATAGTGDGDDDTDPKPATVSSNPSVDPPSPAAAVSASRIRITDRTGNLFAAPSDSLLIHACNSVGSWGGGIALAFRNLYPEAFKIYRAHCAHSTPDQLVGTALLIAPQPRGGGKEGEGGGKKRPQQQQHYIGCLFTSRRYGKARDSPERILRATGPAMRHLMRLVAEEERRKGEGVIKEVRMCKINAGLFAVPWERSKKAIQGLELDQGEVPQCAEDGVVKVVAYERE
ncbi:uncharacterized protein B0T15DRAFT_535385 [Chaetomium strumarium]|uniref:ADP-ribose 1''-phosphate phosphatase n=1 Tax=Chaetomium strumarium TaxID=1170767 RepID=A0AAJ0GQ12_9PEZI|nr:hypothetical protein B0T15DRAFT_535385 [Chaetomium strumarium]